MQVISQHKGNTTESKSKYLNYSKSISHNFTHPQFLNLIFTAYVKLISY